jgi:hypothetical protein
MMQTARMNGLAREDDARVRCAGDLNFICRSQPFSCAGGGSPGWRARPRPLAPAAPPAPERAQPKREKPRIERGFQTGKRGLGGLGHSPSGSSTARTGIGSLPAEIFSAAGIGHFANRRRGGQNQRAPVRRKTEALYTQASIRRVRATGLPKNEENVSG